MERKTLFIYGLAILLGILTGLIGTAFQLAISRVNLYFTLIIDYFARDNFSTAVISALLTMLLVLAAWFLVNHFAPEASGSGIPEIEGALLHKRSVYWRRLLPVKFIGGVLSIGANMVAGREGPTIQMGGNLAAMLGERLKLKPKRLDTLIAAGAGAGLATAFNAPLAGVLFVIEEMRHLFHFNFTNFKIVAISCMTATITCQIILGNAPAISMIVYQTPSMTSLWLFFLFGIASGFLGWIFNQTLMLSLFLTDKFNRVQKICYVAVIGILIGLLSIYYPAVVGGGYKIIQESLAISPSIGSISLLIIFRFIATMLCYNTNVPGGIFAPMLALGTLFGLFCFHGLHILIPDITIHPGMFAVAGMGALFSASIRAPLTGIILIVEMTQNYSLILPLMVSCLTATTTSYLLKNGPIYTQLLHRTLKKPLTR